MNVPYTSNAPVAKRSWSRRVVRAIMIYVCLPYFVVIALAFCFQRRFMYHPASTADLSVKMIDLPSTDSGSKDVRIETPDGDVLKGWHVRRARSEDVSDPAPLLIYFPGNAGNRSHRVHDVREFCTAGFDVLFFDYRGFGDSTGSPSEAKLAADARLVWNYARETLRYEGHRIVLFGESLGGAVVLSLWGTEPPNYPQPAAIVLNSTFAYMPDVVHWHYPHFPLRYLVLDRWPSGDRIARVQCPIILFHGTSDEIVPVSQGHVLVSKTVNGRLIELPGVTHNNVPMGSLRTELERIALQISENSAHLQAPVE